MLVVPANRELQTSVLKAVQPEQRMRNAENHLNARAANLPHPPHKVFLFSW